jgi:hypothetical protein
VLAKQIADYDSIPINLKKRTAGKHLDNGDRYSEGEERGSEESKPDASRRHPNPCNDKHYAPKQQPRRRGSL